MRLALKPTLGQVRNIEVPRPSGPRVGPSSSTRTDARDKPNMARPIQRRWYGSGMPTGTARSRARAFRYPIRERAPDHYRSLQCRPSKPRVRSRNSIYCLTLQACESLSLAHCLAARPLLFGEWRVREIYKLCELDRALRCLAWDQFAQYCGEIRMHNPNTDHRT